MMKDWVEQASFSFRGGKAFDERVAQESTIDMGRDVVAREVVPENITGVYMIDDEAIISDFIHDTLKWGGKTLTK